MEEALTAGGVSGGAGRVGASEGAPGLVVPCAVVAHPVAVHVAAKPGTHLALVRDHLARAQERSEGREGREGRREGRHI